MIERRFTNIKVNIVARDLFNYFDTHLDIGRPKIKTIAENQYTYKWEKTLPCKAIRRMSVCIFSEIISLVISNDIRTLFETNYQLASKDKNEVFKQISKDIKSFWEIC